MSLELPVWTLGPAFTLLSPIILEMTGGFDFTYWVFANVIAWSCIGIAEMSYLMYRKIRRNK